MSDQVPSQRLHIALTDEQRQQIKEAFGQDVGSLEFTAVELEQRIAPLLHKI